MSRYLRRSHPHHDEIWRVLWSWHFVSPRPKHVRYDRWAVVIYPYARDRLYYLQGTNYSHDDLWRIR